MMRCMAWLPLRFSALCVLLVIAACTPLAVRSPDSVAARQRSTGFLLEGRISATDGQQNVSGRVTWQHASYLDEWTLYSPLGNIVGQLRHVPAQGAVLRMADGTQYREDNVQTMLPRLLGVDAPVSALADWVQATPQVSARVLAYDDAGRPARMSEGGWIVEYPAYADNTGSALPKRVVISRGETRLTLVIDRWQPQ